MMQLARHPNMFQPLRDEIVEVLSRDGLKKTALYNLKLMDSFIKECQRLKPIIIGMQGVRKPKSYVVSSSLTRVYTPLQ